MIEATPDAAERAVIGAILLSSGDAIDDLHLEPLDFKSPALGTLYALMRRMRIRGQPIDVVTIAEAIAHSREPELRDVGPANLHQLIQETPSTAAAAFYEAIVERAAVVRRLKAATRTMAQAAEGDMPADDLIEAARQAVDAVAGQVRMQARSVADDMPDALRALREPPEQVPTPWPELDDILGGFRPGRLYVVGARPAVGKTVVALHCCLTLARHGAVAYSSLEMSRGEIITRALSMGARIGGRHITAGRLSQGEWDRVNAASERLAQLPIHIDDRSDITITQVLQHARAVGRRQPLAGIVLDYLQLMRGDRGERRPRHEVVAEYSRQLKIMARELHVPVIALSQLNRASTMRPDGRPALADLRESGAVEQDADVVILLHRDLNDPDKCRTLHLNIAKNRQGEVGNVALTFIGDFTEARSRKNP